MARILLTDDVEIVDFRALGGADVVTVDDLAGTDVTSVKANLASPEGGGDGAIDQVVVRGTGGDDVALVTGSSGTAGVFGLKAVVSITNSEPTDALSVDLSAGDDVLIGGPGADQLNCGPGNDIVLPDPFDIVGADCE